MSNCTAADTNLLVSKGAAIQTCLETASPTNPYFPAGSVVVGCLNPEGVSTECSSCWGTVYDSYKSCLIDTCDWTSTTLATSTKPAGCCTCLSNLGNVAGISGTSICGVDTSKYESEFGKEAGTKLEAFMSTCTSSTNGVSVRSVATSAILFAMIMMSM